MAFYVGSYWVLGGGGSRLGDNAAEDDPEYTVVPGGGSVDTGVADIGDGAAGFTLFYESLQAKTITITAYAYIAGLYSAAGSWVAISPTIASSLTPAGGWNYASFTPPACKKIRFNIANNAGADADVRAVLMYGG